MKTRSVNIICSLQGDLQGDLQQNTAYIMEEKGCEMLPDVVN